MKECDILGVHKILWLLLYNFTDQDPNFQDLCSLKDYSNCVHIFQMTYRRLFRLPGHSSRLPWALCRRWCRRRRRWRAYKGRGWCFPAGISRRQVGSVHSYCSSRIAASGRIDLHRTRVYPCLTQPSCSRHWYPVQWTSWFTVSLWNYSDVNNTNFLRPRPRPRPRPK